MSSTRHGNRMTNLYLKIPRTPDRVVLERFAKLKVDCDFSSSSASAPFGIDINSIPVTIDLDHATGVLGSILKNNGYILQNAALARDGIDVIFYRGGRDGSEGPFFDEILVRYNGQGQPSADTRLSIVAAVQNEFETFSEDRVLSIPLPESKQLAALYQERMDRLENLNAELIRSTTETYTRLEREFYDRKLGNDRDLAEKKSYLDIEYQQKLGHLRNEEAELENKKRELDDRSNTHARRSLRDRMLENVESRIANFGVSVLTAKKRNPVRIAMILLCVSLLCLTFWTAIELHTQQKSYIDVAYAVVRDLDIREQTQSGSKPVEQPPLNALSDSSRTLMYLLWARLSLLSLGFVAALIYYIRWESRWADQHSAAEFQLHQFRLDVNRANWVIESGLEWQKETKTEVPGGILEGLTRNLFRSQNEPPPALHPADELASALLGSASKLKLKNGDNELEFNNPGKIPKEKV
jgi:hypothetical protein